MSITFYFYLTGAKRETVDEMEFGNFDLFSNGCPYNSLNFQYDEDQFERLAKLVQFNVRNNLEKIRNQIRRCAGRRGKRATK